MKKRRLFEPDPFGVSLDFTEEFIDDVFDNNNKSEAHIDRNYPCAQQNQIIENEQT